MQVPLDISFRGLESSPETESHIREKVSKLEEFCDRITSCQVVVEATHRHQQGDLYHVRIYLTVPRRELVVDRQPAAEHAHEDLQVALRDAFKSARRQVQDYVRETTGRTKHHEEPAHGVVTELFDEAGYGFIQTPEGRYVYFHFHSLLTDIAELAVGAQVRFVEEQGQEGPQATSVRIVGRHHQFAN